jgi:hypothetical protein
MQQATLEVYRELLANTGDKILPRGLARWRMRVAPRA